MVFFLEIGVSSAAGKDIPRGEDFSGVGFRGGLLRVSVKNQNFKEVIDEVARKTGIRIVFNHPADEYLTVSFDYLPLEKGLKRLLRGRNYVFTYLPGEAQQPAKLAQVLVFSKSEERSVAGPGGIPENRLADRAGQREPVKKIFNVDQKELNEALKAFPMEGVDLEKEFHNGLESIQEMEGFEEAIQREKFLKGFSQEEVGLKKKLHDTFENKGEK